MKELKNLLGELKLFGIREVVDFRLMEGAKAGLGYEDLLKLLIEDEQLHRMNAKAERLRKKATFKDSVLLADFYVNLKRGISKIMIKEFQTLNFLRGFENIILLEQQVLEKVFWHKQLDTQLVCLEKNQDLSL